MSASNRPARRRLLGRPTELGRPMMGEHLLRSVIDSTVDGIVAVDEHGNVRFTNPAAIRLLGRPVEQIMGDPFPYPQRAGTSAEVMVSHASGVTMTLELRTAEVDVDGERLRVTDIRDVTEIVRLQRELEALSRTDELTGLYNRRGFVSMCERYLRLADRTDRGVLVLFLDVDRLKQINDTCGHAAGDATLVLAATALCTAMRGTDILARVGGDEFAVASPNVSNADIAAVRGRVDETIRALNQGHGTPYDLTVSLGAAFYEPHTGRTVADLLADADADMYTQKRLRAQSTPVARSACTRGRADTPHRQAAG
jgi:two-component system, cell cycle response regulator